MRRILLVSVLAFACSVNALCQAPQPLPGAPPLDQEQTDKASAMIMLLVAHGLSIDDNGVVTLQNEQGIDESLEALLEKIRDIEAAANDANGEDYSFQFLLGTKLVVVHVRTGELGSAGKTGDDNKDGGGAAGGGSVTAATAGKGQVSFGVGGGGGRGGDGRKAGPGGPGGDGDAPAEKGGLGIGVGGPGGGGGDSAKPGLGGFAGKGGKGRGFSSGGAGEAIGAGGPGGKSGRSGEDVIGEQGGSGGDAGDSVRSDDRVPPRGGDGETPGKGQVIKSGSPGPSVAAGGDGGKGGKGAKGADGDELSGKGGAGAKGGEGIGPSDVQVKGGMGGKGGEPGDQGGAQAPGSPGVDGGLGDAKPHGN